MALSPSQVAEKWKRNLGASSESYKQGVASVSVAPGELAARSADRALANYQDSIQSGRFQAACRNVSLSDWQRQCSDVGASRLTAGAAKGASKVNAFMSNFLPVMQQVSQEVANMPKGTLQDSLNRVMKVMEAGKRFANKRV